MSAQLPESPFAVKQFGKPTLLFIAAIFCTGIALFAGTNAWKKADAARPGGTRKGVHLKNKKFAGSAPVNGFTHDAPVSIDYNGHDFTFHTGKPVALTPTSSGVDSPAPGVYGSPVVLGSGLTFNQNGVALDAAGDIYVNDQNGGAGNIKKITADGSSTTIIGSGFLAQSGNMAVDKAGNVYVVDQSAVWKIQVGATPGTYDAPVIINGNFGRPFAIAADTTGNIYVTDLNGGVYKMANDGTGKIRIDNAINNGSGIAGDAAGNMYVVDFVAQALYEIPASGGTEVQLATGFNFPRAVAVDGTGNIYVSDEGTGSI
ncbi:MAG: NHL repeat-containing protein, partial [Mucilaginibacter sp.]